MQRLEEFIASEIQSAHRPPRPLQQGECASNDGTPCGLCHAMALEYPDECTLKQRALARFWSQHLGAHPLDPLVASPRGRSYRTVTKRKAFPTRTGIRLGFVGPSGHGRPGGIPVARCAIEPESHAALYAAHEETLNAPWCAALRDSLAYVVLKGNYRRVTVIWNVRQIAPAVTRAANALSKSLTRSFGDRINAVFLYEGSDEGRYYLGTRNPAAKPDLRKLYGNPDVLTQVGGRTYLYPPLSFSQVNESMMETFLARARSLLGLRGQETLFDLYCGYGLFALSLANAARQVIGVEVSHASIAAARANARQQGIRNCRFFCSDIRADWIERTMPDVHGETVVVLDPPRSGTAAGVLQALARRAPSRVLHIFCNSDLLPPDLQCWTENGYRVVRATPLDMFPGTPEVETVVLLQPQAYGRSSKGMS